ncbi:hypothetical protein K1719_025425 [Acacia pycnantha]|nr:hypothetical protein K1719_025425 [Acacia pycnantha]
MRNKINEALISHWQSMRQGCLLWNKVICLKTTTPKIKVILAGECDPYFDDIGCSHPGCQPKYPTPKCVRKCVNQNHFRRNSKHYSANVYRINSDPYDNMVEAY